MHKYYQEEDVRFAQLVLGVKAEMPIQDLQVVKQLAGVYLPRKLSELQQREPCRRHAQVLGVAGLPKSRQKKAAPEAFR